MTSTSMSRTQVPPLADAASREPGYVPEGLFGRQLAARSAYSTLIETCGLAL
jgi:hypothetical protein